jgi:hypothetical protein
MPVLFVRLDPDLDKALAHLAIERQTSKSALVREWVRNGVTMAALDAVPPQPAPQSDHLFRTLMAMQDDLEQGTGPLTQ